VKFSCGLAFLLLPYAFAPGDLVRLFTPDAHPHERSLLFSYFMGLVLVYGHYYVLVLQLYFRQRYLWYGLAVLGGLLHVCGTLYYTDLYRPTAGLDHPPPVPRGEAWKPPVEGDMRHAAMLFLAGGLATLTLRLQRRLGEAPLIGVLDHGGGRVCGRSIVPLARGVGR
jgi:hypothetical protein